MLNAELVIRFKGKEYKESMYYHPSHILETCSDLYNQIKEQNPKLAEGFVKATERTKVRQDTYLISTLSGYLGEQILKDFLTEKGFNVKPAQISGDLFAENSKGKYVIECKTCRNDSIVLRKSQLKLNEAAAKKLGAESVVYVILIRFRCTQELAHMVILEPRVIRHIYDAYVIRDINQLIRGRRRGRKIIKIPRSELFKHGKSRLRNYPFYYVH